MKRLEGAVRLHLPEGSIDHFQKVLLPFPHENADLTVRERLVQKRSGEAAVLQEARQPRNARAVKTSVKILIILPAFIGCSKYPRRHAAEESLGQPFQLRAEFSLPVVALAEIKIQFERRVL